MQEFILLIWLGAAALSDEEKQQRSLQIVTWTRGLRQGVVISSRSFWDYGYNITGSVTISMSIADSEEALSGYMVIHAKSIQEAVEIAKTFPGINCGGSVEVRELRELNQQKRSSGF